MADLRATPMVNPVMGLLADRLKKVQQFGAKPFGYENPPVEMLMNLLGVPAVQQTMERMAYGEPLTTGSGMTTKPRAEAVEAAMAVAPVAGLLGKATKGLPVGASIKPINIEKGIYKPDLTMEEMLKVRDIPTVERVQKSVELVGEKQFEKMVDAQFKKYKPSSPEQEAMLVESVTLQILGKAERSPFPRKEALDTAQRNAALPVEKGGLGLPKDNTPEMRAEAMGFNTELLHGTAKDFPSFDLSKAGTNTRQAGDELGIFSTSKPFLANDYAQIASKGGWANRTEPENAVVYPLLGSFKNPKKYQTASEFYRDADAMAAEQKLGKWREKLQSEGYDSVFVRPDLEEVVAFNPNQLRSRFAAFDPMRRNEPDLLAGVLPLGLLSDEEQRKKLYELVPTLLGQ
jgi:hypothetical protein